MTVERTHHVWHIAHPGSATFATEDTVIRCETPDVAEARTRAGLNLQSPGATLRYLGTMTTDTYDALLAEYRSR
ncbi:hypothetical protein KIH27_18505 [Mycobacterium sp. M1]|uniref:Uncharacterized protein n=1 Tax=Mycolicibacter acidiphilus TaxID=2835306 RepID=A0ABS5RPY5_9MYCO|nr:hypothetical protein [Mycolicibacter acidiphilus]MBS9535581.1 hypothetical protein [Mycolicibacter acidiphilus]